MWEAECHGKREGAEAVANLPYFHNQVLFLLTLVNINYINYTITITDWAGFFWKQRQSKYEIIKTKFFQLQVNVQPSGN